MSRPQARWLLVLLAVFACVAAAAQPKPRARDLGIPFDGTAGPLDSITDVAGIEVGFTTLISGGPTTAQAGPQVRTGVTAILPRGRMGTEPVFAGFFSQNGNGEMTGLLSRTELLVLGRAPYRDFFYLYGPAMLYLPCYLYTFAHGLLSIEQAYFGAMIAQWIAGLYLLTVCIRLLFPPAQRVVIFWVVAFTFLNFTLGVNYTPLRFVLPLAAILILAVITERIW